MAQAVAEQLPADSPVAMGLGWGGTRPVRWGVWDSI
jgi:hypothetical protein